MKEVIVAGGTGYLGRPLIDKLCADGFRVKAVVRPQSVAKVPAGSAAIIGDVLNARTYQDQIPLARRSCTWWACRIQLHGKPPNSNPSI